MRLTAIAGTLIRILAVAPAQIQENAESNSWLDSLTLSKGKIHNGGDGQLVPGRNDAPLEINIMRS